ncbi:hypothetical protein L7F22_041635 [Adiantum nelumboides]|nr:hypothetical protein [Adiantum nelumboides]
MASRKMKDRRGPTEAKEEPLSEEASSPLGDDASHKKRRGRPRKAGVGGMSTPAAAYIEPEDTTGGGGEYNVVEEEEEGEASNNEEEDETEALKGAIAHLNEEKREVQVVVKKKTRRASTPHSHRHVLRNDGKDGLDLQSEILIKCFGRTNRFHRRKGKPNRAAQASF